ncbi:MAG TPA: penicillin-binding protein 2 [Dehalococcoidia bacterium]|nr:penicillin-binding protein 2 [Dehalococcoidia bacterium]
MGLLAGSRRRRWRAEHAETNDPQTELKLKLNLLRLVVVLAFGVLTVQLARLQLVRGGEFEQRAELNQLRVEPVIPSRGLIYDRNGVPLVENVPSFSAAIVAADVPRDHSLQTAAAVEQLIGVPAIETTLKLEQARRSNDPFTPVILKDGLDESEAFHLREQLAKLPGVQVLVEPVRHYTQGALVSDVLGYIGRVDEQDYAELKDKGYIASDRIGKAGVEATYEQYLRGEPGRKEIEKDASGREIQTLSQDPATPGNDLVLSIDLDLQKKATELTQQAAHGGQAAAVVMDVHTGEVLALVSLPMYDDNIFSGKVDEARLEQYLNDPNKPLVNHALAEQYAPGSIFKQITGAAALQEGVATASTTITSNGYITVPNQYDPSILYTFKDWRTLGTLDFYGGVAMSSDVYFYYLAGGYHWYGQNFEGLGPDRLALYARAFGLGHPTGIDIAGEADGNIPDPGWKEKTFGDVWTIGDTYNMGIGQGFVAATPIQMVRVTAAVANGGTLLVPRVVREVRDAQQHVIKPNDPVVERQIPVSAQNFAILREAMRQAVSWGSANQASMPDLQIAGKTGTAEFGERHSDGTYETHAWFSGFAPADNPQVAVTVFLERGVGAIDAAPLAAKILDYWYHRAQQGRSVAAAPGQGAP